MLFIRSPSYLKRNTAVFNLPTRSDKSILSGVFSSLSCLQQKAPLTAAFRQHSTHESHFHGSILYVRSTGFNPIKQEGAAERLPLSIQDVEK